MRHTIVLLATLGLLASCAGDVRSVRLADIDLRDMTRVQQIRARLNAGDSAAFASYVLRHSTGSTGFCGRPLANSAGDAPDTVGDAVDLARARDVEERRALAEASRPKLPIELARERWNELVSQRDNIITAQTRLRMMHGPAATRLPEWRSLLKRLSDVDDRLVGMRSGMFPAGAD
jgi:hypothetical protein